jgi:hypothetical protein
LVDASRAQHIRWHWSGTVSIWFIGNETGIDAGLVLLGQINQSTIAFTFTERRNSSSRFSFSQGRLFLATVNLTTQDQIAIADRPLLRDLANEFIGITAESGEYTSLVVLQRVTFHLSDERFAFRLSGEHAALIPRVDHFVPRVRHCLCNPVFFSMRTEILQMEKVRADLRAQTDRTSVRHVLNVTDELNEVSYGVASFSDLNAFIRTTMIPYAQGWRKRTAQILGYVTSAKETTQPACTIARDIASDFSLLKNLSIASTEGSVNDLARELRESLLADHLLSPDRIVEYSSLELMGRALTYIAVIELAVVGTWICLHDRVRGHD